jgi:hypothetical protein
MPDKYDEMRSVLLGLAREIDQSLNVLAKGNLSTDRENLLKDQINSRLANIIILANEGEARNNLPPYPAWLDINKELLIKFMNSGVLSHENQTTLGKRFNIDVPEAPVETSIKYVPYQWPEGMFSSELKGAEYIEVRNAFNKAALKRVKEAHKRVDKEKGLTPAQKENIKDELTMLYHTLADSTEDFGRTLADRIDMQRRNMPMTDYKAHSHFGSELYAIHAYLSQDKMEIESKVLQRRQKSSAEIPLAIMPTAAAAASATTESQATVPTKRKGIFAKFSNVKKETQPSQPTAAPSLQAPTSQSTEGNIEVSTAKIDGKDLLQIKFYSEEARTEFVKEIEAQAKLQKIDTKGLFSDDIRNPLTLNVNPSKGRGTLGVYITEGKLSINLGNETLRNEFTKRLGLTQEHAELHKGESTRGADAVYFHHTRF